MGREALLSGTPEPAVQFTVAEKSADQEGLAALGTTPVPPTITLLGIELVTEVVERCAWTA